MRFLQTRSYVMCNCQKTLCIYLVSINSMYSKVNGKIILHLWMCTSLANFVIISQLFDIKWQNIIWTLRCYLFILFPILWGVFCIFLVDQRVFQPRGQYAFKYLIYMEVFLLFFFFLTIWNFTWRGYAISS